MLGCKCFSGKRGFFILRPHGTDRAPQTLSSSFHFFCFHFFCFKLFLSLLQFSQSQTVRCSVFLVFHKLFCRYQHVLNRRYVHRLCSAAQNLMLGSHSDPAPLCTLGQVSSFKVTFLAQQLRHSGVVGSGVRVFVEGSMGGLTLYGPTGDVLHRPKCSSLSQKHNFCQVTENSVTFCVLI